MEKNHPEAFWSFQDATGKWEVSFYHWWIAYEATWIVDVWHTDRHRTELVDEWRYSRRDSARRRYSRIVGNLEGQEFWRQRLARCVQEAL